jgi:hypothetical protein
LFEHKCSFTNGQQEKSLFPEIKESNRSKATVQYYNVGKKLPNNSMAHSVTIDESRHFSSSQSDLFNTEYFQPGIMGSYCCLLDPGLSGVSDELEMTLFLYPYTLYILGWKKFDPFNAMFIKNLSTLFDHFSTSLFSRSADLTRNDVNSFQSSVVCERATDNNRGDNLVFSFLLVGKKGRKSRNGNRPPEQELVTAPLNQE